MNGHVPDGALRGEGMKTDGGKDRWDLLPPRPLYYVVRVLTKGAAKYAPDNWQNVKDARARYTAAALRHIHAWREGEVLDSEWHLPHLAHAICCLMFLMWFDENKSARPDGED